MSHFESLPAWIALPAALFVVIGSTLTFLGALGFVRLRNFYDRLHAPTLGTSWGAAALLLASIAINSWNAGQLVVHELVIGCFLMITLPVSLMLLGRAALYRDRMEGRGGVPVFGYQFHPAKTDDEDLEEPDPMADEILPDPLADQETSDPLADQEAGDRQAEQEAGDPQGEAPKPGPAA